MSQDAPKTKRFSTATAEADPVPTVRAIRRFKVEFSHTSIEDLRNRLQAARFPPRTFLPEDETNAQTAPPPAWLERVLHFVHKRSERRDAIPLMLVHGWPGTFHEFLHVIEKLTSPSDPKDPAFHVVVPSLPGFIFSSAPPTRDHKIGDVHGYCRILNALMIGIGYGGSPACSEWTNLTGINANASTWQGYAVQGGDWGSAHARILANIKGSKVKAVHLNFCPARPTGWVGGSMYAAFISVPMSVKMFIAEHVLGPDAKKALERANRFQESMSYYHVQHWRPGQLMPGLIDSPVGLLAWLGYFNYARLPPIAKSTSKTFTLHSLLTTVSLFWLTSSIGTSFLPYTLNEFLADIVVDPKEFIKVPFGFSEFPFEIVTTPARWVAGTGNLVWAAKATRGGHFAALEEPEVFVAHLQEAFARKRKDAKNNERAMRVKDTIKSLEVDKGGLWDVEYKKVRQRL